MKKCNGLDTDEANTLTGAEARAKAMQNPRANVQT
jgi:hypothetical protein